MRNLMITIGAAVSLAAAVCGCSGKDPGAGKAAANQVHRKAAQATNGLSPGMVAAVAPPGAGPSTVQVKFELQGHPDVAQPLDVDVVIVPVFGNVDRISGKFTADDGLEVVSGQDIPVAEKPVEGTPIHYTVRVLPKRDGVFTLTVALTVDAAGRSTSQIFSMPVIAGAGPPAEAGTAHPAAAAQ
jgi:hypothetical protein